MGANDGFSLLEIFLVMSVIAILAGISFPFYKSFQAKNNLDLSSDVLIQQLRRAQVSSQAVAGDSNWGVYAGEGKITLFKGDNYFSRETDFDDVFKTSGNLSFSGISEIVFDKFSGWPKMIGNFILISGNLSKNIYVNEKGAISH